MKYSDFVRINRIRSSNGNKNVWRYRPWCSIVCLLQWLMTTYNMRCVIGYVRASSYTAILIQGGSIKARLNIINQPITIRMKCRLAAGSLIRYCQSLVIRYVKYDPNLKTIVFLLNNHIIRNYLVWKVCMFSLVFIDPPCISIIVLPAVCTISTR